MADTLSLAHLRALLKVKKSFPDNVRHTCWKFLLALPNDVEVFEVLRDKGIHPRAYSLSGLFPIGDRRLLKRLVTVCSALYFWSEDLASVTWLPRFAFPFVKFWGTDVVSALETVMVLLKSYQNWLQFRDVPPNREIVFVDSLYAKFYGGVSSAASRPADWAWTIFTTVFTDQLTGSEWLQFCDHWFSSGRVAYFYVAMAAFASLVPDSCFIQALRAPYEKLSLGSLIEKTKYVLDNWAGMVGNAGLDDETASDTEESSKAGLKRPTDWSLLFSRRLELLPLSGILDMPRIVLPKMSVLNLKKDLQSIKMEQTEFLRAMKRAHFKHVDDPNDTLYDSSVADGSVSSMFRGSGDAQEQSGRAKSASACQTHTVATQAEHSKHDYYVSRACESGLQGDHEFTNRPVVPTERLSKSSREPHRSLQLSVSGRDKGSVSLQQQRQQRQGAAPAEADTSCDLNLLGDAADDLAESLRHDAGLSGPARRPSVAVGTAPQALDAGGQAPDDRLSVARSIAKEMAKELAKTSCELELRKKQVEDDYAERRAVHPAVARLTSVRHDAAGAPAGSVVAQNVVNLSEQRRQEAHERQRVLEDERRRRIGSSAQGVLLSRLQNVRCEKRARRIAAQGEQQALPHDRPPVDYRTKQIRESVVDEHTRDILRRRDSRDPAQCCGICHRRHVYDADHPCSAEPLQAAAEPPNKTRQMIRDTVVQFLTQRLAGAKGAQGTEGGDGSAASAAVAASGAETGTGTSVEEAECVDPRIVEEAVHSVLRSIEERTTSRSSGTASTPSVMRTASSGTSSSVHDRVSEPLRGSGSVAASGAAASLGLSATQVVDIRPLGGSSADKGAAQPLSGRSLAKPFQRSAARSSAGSQPRTPSRESKQSRATSQQTASAATSALVGQGASLTEESLLENVESALHSSAQPPLPPAKQRAEGAASLQDVPDDVLLQMIDNIATTMAMDSRQGPQEGQGEQGRHDGGASAVHTAPAQASTAPAGSASQSVGSSGMVAETIAQNYNLRAEARRQAARGSRVRVSGTQVTVETPAPIADVVIADNYSEDARASQGSILSGEEEESSYGAASAPGSRPDADDEEYLRRQRAIREELEREMELSAGTTASNASERSRARASSRTRPQQLESTAPEVVLGARDDSSDHARPGGYLGREHDADKTSITCAASRSLYPTNLSKASEAAIASVVGGSASRAQHHPGSLFLSAPTDISNLPRPSTTVSAAPANAGASVTTNAAAAAGATVAGARQRASAADRAGAGANDARYANLRNLVADIQAELGSPQSTEDDRLISSLQNIVARAQQREKSGSSYSSATLGASSVAVSSRDISLVDKQGALSRHMQVPVVVYDAVETPNRYVTDVHSRASITPTTSSSGSAGSGHNNTSGATLSSDKDLTLSSVANPLSSSVISQRAVPDVNTDTTLPEPSITNPRTRTDPSAGYTVSEDLIRIEEGLKKLIEKTSDHDLPSPSSTTAHTHATTDAPSQSTDSHISEARVAAAGPRVPHKEVSFRDDSCLPPASESVAHARLQSQMQVQGSVSTPGIQAMIDQLNAAMQSDLLCDSTTAPGPSVTPDTATGLSAMLNVKTTESLARPTEDYDGSDVDSLAGAAATLSKLTEAVAREIVGEPETGVPLVVQLGASQSSSSEYDYPRSVGASPQQQESVSSHADHRGPQGRPMDLHRLESQSGNDSSSPQPVTPFDEKPDSFTDEAPVSVDGARGIDLSGKTMLETADLGISSKKISDNLQSLFQEVHNGLRKLESEMGVVSSTTSDPDIYNNVGSSLNTTDTSKTR